MQAQPLPWGCRVYEGAAAARRLAEFGLRQDYFHAAARHGDDRRSRCRPVHPKSYQGQVMWAETIGEVRSQLLDLGHDWEIGRENNYDTVFSPSRRISIAVVGGDTNTGEHGFEHPKTARRRGPITAKRVNRNLRGQLSLLDDITSEDQEPTEDLCSTWFFLLNARNNRLYGELSLPVHMGGKSRISHWAERIIFAPLELVGAVTPIEPREPARDRPIIRVERKPSDA